MKGSISKWGVSKVITMKGMFYAVYVFNGDISKLDTSSVTTMQLICHYTRAFNGNMGRVDGDNHGSMFCDAISINGDISKWHMPMVTNVAWMCCDANSFNGVISKWDVSKVIKEYEDDVLVCITV